MKSSDLSAEVVSRVEVAVRAGVKGVHDALKPLVDGAPKGEAALALTNIISHEIAALTGLTSPDRAADLLADAFEAGLLKARTLLGGAPGALN